MKRFASFWGFFQRPLVVTVNKPNGWQIFWAIVTIVLMGNLLLAGFAGKETAGMFADLFGEKIANMYQILKGVSVGAVLMALLSAFGSNQVSVPFAMLENHRPTAVMVGLGLAVVGIVLNWPAVVAFFNKFDLLWATLTVAGIGLLIWALFGPGIVRYFNSRRTSATTE